MSYNVVIPVSGEIDALLQQARQAAAKADGTLVGDSKAGTFTGQTPLGAIKGKYAVSGQTVIITISDKPWLLPMSAIEKELRGYFA